MRITRPPLQLAPLQLRVRDVLLEWDPIGVRGGGDGGPVDEYDDLIDPILAALGFGPSADELAEDLRTVLETDYRLDVGLRACRDAADALIARFGRPAIARTS